MKFNYKKATQLINFFILKSGKKHLGKLEILKLVFLADRYHLRKYGRSITNDEYWAMPYGPVASAVKDITDLTDFLADTEKKYASTYIAKCYSHCVKSIKNVNYDVFSETDIEALNKTIELKNNVKDLVKYTHKFPEWKKHQASLESDTSSRIPMDITDFFSETEPDIEYCKVDKELLEMNKVMFIEDEHVSKLWS